MTDSPTVKYTKFWFCVTFLALFLTIVSFDLAMINEKTYKFNDTTYVLFFNTFVTFGVPYICIYCIFWPIARTADYPHQGSFVSKWEKQVSRSPTPADNIGGSLVPYRKRYPFFFPFSGSQHALVQFLLAGTFLGSLNLNKAKKSPVLIIVMVTD